MPAKRRPAMPVVDAIKVLIQYCDRNWIVVTNQSSARTWPKLVQRPLDLHYNPSTMGGAVSLALGLALAQPKRRVLCVTGDGALLMNLGSLVTVAACAPKNLVVCVLDNRLYEVTGGQQLPGRAGQALDYNAIALAVGFNMEMEFDELREWKETAETFFSLTGPSLLRLAVQPTPPEYLQFKTPAIAEQLASFRAALVGSVK
jgi:thiamine pyrophosphate-dependent acetolactate synthase large subunit-like protein